MLTAPVTTIMTPDPEVVQTNDSLLVVKKMFEQPRFHHHIPVVENGRLAGMISLYDFILAMRGASLDDSEPVYHARKASDIMSRDLKTCTSHSTIQQALDLILHHHVHGLPVTEEGRLIGIITSHDILRALAGGEFIRTVQP
jgi:CBS domain-containing protein